MLEEQENEERAWVYNWQNERLLGMIVIDTKQHLVIGIVCEFNLIKVVALPRVCESPYEKEHSFSDGLEFELGEQVR